MKNLIPILALAIVLFSCNKDVKKTKAPVEETPLTERPIPPLPGASTSNSVIGGAHYICPKNCVGGNGPAAGACPICQTEMAHNQGFHASANPNAISTPASTTTPQNTNGPNANGQYHYTCDKGCAGGSGSAGNCSNCGNTLAHNQAFHS